MYTHFITGFDNLNRRNKRIIQISQKVLHNEISRSNCECLIAHLLSEIWSIIHDYPDNNKHHEISIGIILMFEIISIEHVLYRLNENKISKRFSHINQPAIMIVSLE